MPAYLILGLVAAVVVALVAFVAMKIEAAARRANDNMSPEERSDFLAEQREAELRSTYGEANPEMICPHCRNKGTVRTQRVQRKKGISGDKAAAAVLTGGLSVAATGLSRKETLTQARCDSCENTWDF